MSEPAWDAAVRVETFANTEVAAQRQFTWEIRDWSRLEERQVSEPIECGGHLFQVLLFPHGNPASPRKGSLALYLNALGPAPPGSPNDVKKLKLEPAGDDEAAAGVARPWHVCAAFALTMYNPESPKTLLTQCSHHRFTPRVTDWGYSEFTSLRSAFVPSMNGRAPLIAALKPHRTLGVNIRVDIQVLADPTGILWHDFQDYDSREVTGYTGLVNQGATCYLNSLLQSLYFTTAFRNAVYAIPDSAGVTGGLQRLFYKLATSHPPVDTTDLTKAFGWDSADAFTQHDVQELARVLMDRLESKMKGTQVDGFLTKLFVGEMKSYIKCINVPFESSRTEEFWDVQLNVKNMKNVYASFADYCAAETLEGDNQYAAGEHGLQNAVKGVTFTSLPPVLHLQLKRYDYDWMRDAEIKINDRFEYPLELDLTDFVETPSDKSSGKSNEKSGEKSSENSGEKSSENSGEKSSENPGEKSTESRAASTESRKTSAESRGNPSEPRDDRASGKRRWKYHLHGVLVHSGELNAGHYYALIKPEVRGDWFRFDDDRVTRAALHEVLDENYGGNEGSAVKRVTSAYMLVYIREDALDFVLPAGHEAPPPALAHKIEQELDAEERRMRAVAEQQQFMTLRVLSEATYKHHEGLGLLPWSSGANEFEEPSSLKVRLETPLTSLCRQLRAGTLWLAPPNPVVPNARARSQKLQPLPLNQDYVARQMADWVEHPSPLIFAGPDIPMPTANSRMVFVKRFAHGVLRATGVRFVPMAAEPLGQALPVPAGDRVFLEMTTPSHRSAAGLLVGLDPSRTGAELGIESSDIVILAAPDQDVEGYFDTLVNRVTLLLTPIYDDDSGSSDSDRIGLDDESSTNSFPSDTAVARAHSGDSDSDVTGKPTGDAAPKPDKSTSEGSFGEHAVVIDLRDSYHTILQQIGEVVGFDPARLQLRSLSTRNKRSTIIASSGENFSDLWSYSHSDVVQVLYRKLPVSLAEFESMVELPVAWLANGYAEGESEKVLLHPPNVSAKTALAKQTGLTPSDIVMWVGRLSYDAEEISDAVTLGKINSRHLEGYDIYAAPLSPREAAARKTNGARVFMCFHYNKDPSRTHSVPFQLAIVPHEPFAVTKKRVLELLRPNGKDSDKSLEKIRFTVVRERAYETVYLKDDTLVLYDQLHPSDRLGLDHPDPHRNHFHQQAIHID